MNKRGNIIKNAMICMHECIMQEWMYMNECMRMNDHRYMYAMHAMYEIIHEYIATPPT